MCNILAGLKTAAPTNPANGAGGSSWSCSGLVPTTNICTWQGVTCNDFNPVIGINVKSANSSCNVFVTQLNIVSESLLVGANATLSPSIGLLSYLNLLTVSEITIGGTIPSEIGNLVRLRSLILHDSQFTGSIPNTIDNLTSLRYIDFSWNKLSKKIFPAMCHLNKIIDFKLNNNALTGNVPAGFCCLGTLTSLNLGYKNLECFPDCLTTELGVSTNPEPIALATDAVANTCTSCPGTTYYNNYTTPLNLVFGQTYGADTPYKKCTRKYLY